MKARRRVAALFLYNNLKRERDVIAVTLLVTGAGTLAQRESEVMEESDMRCFKEKMEHIEA